MVNTESTSQLEMASLKSEEALLRFYPERRREKVKMLLRSGKLFKFEELSKREVALIMGIKVTHAFVAAFLSWLVLGEFLEKSKGAENFLFPEVNWRNGAGIWERIAGQGVWSFLIEASGHFPAPLFTSLFSFKDLMRNYITVDHTTNILQHNTKIKNFAKKISEMEIDEAFKKSLITTIGDNAFMFTFLGTKGKGIARKLQRIFLQNLPNQLVQSAKMTRKHAEEHLTAKGIPKKISFLLSALLKVAYTTKGFFIKVVGVEFAEDFSAAIAGIVLKLSNPVAAAIAALPATLLTAVKEKRASTLKIVSNIGLKRGVEFKEILSHMLHVDGGIKEYTNKEFYTDYLQRSMFRAIGRIFAEIPIKYLFVGSDGNFANGAVEACYQGLRNALFQQPPKNGGPKIITTIFNFINRPTEEVKKLNLFNKTFNQGTIKGYNLTDNNTLREGVDVLITEITQIQECIDIYLQKINTLYLKNERVNEGKHYKDQKNLMKNWFLNLKALDIKLQNTIDKIKQVKDKSLETDSINLANTRKSLAISLVTSSTEASNLAESAQSIAMLFEQNIKQEHAKRHRIPMEEVKVNIEDENRLRLLNGIRNEKIISIINKTGEYNETSLESPWDISLHPVKLKNLNMSDSPSTVRQGANEVSLSKAPSRHPTLISI